MKVIRKSELRPILIKKPYINLIGPKQTNLLQEVFRTEFFADGLLDRFLFVYPKDKTISVWKRNVSSSARPDILNQWRTIINKILDIPCNVNEKENSVIPAILTMTAEAEAYFYDWYNRIIDSVNAIENDAEVESRKMKLNGHAARLALLFQIMKWAVDETGMQYVELSSVKATVRMVDYYEETYRRIQEIIVSDSIGETREAWLSLLGDTFSTGDAIVAGNKVEMSRRTVYYALDQLCRLHNPLIEKIRHGVYRKTAVGNANAPCAIALSTDNSEGQSSQSAKMQSATQINSDSHE